MGFLETMLLVAKYTTMKISDLITEKSQLPKTGGMYNSMVRLHKAVQIRKQRKNDQIEKKLAKWAEKIKWWNKFLWILGLTTAIEELLRHSYIAEDMYATGEIDSPEALQQYREFLWGQFVLTTLTPTLVSKLKITSIVMFIVRVIITAMTAAGAIVVSPTGIGAVGGAAVLVAEQAFFTGLQMFLQSEMATNFLAERLFKPLVWLGTVPEAIWNELAEKVTGTNAYQDAAKKQAATPQPATKPVSSTPAVAQANDYAAATKQLDAQPEPTGSILDREIY
jgi:hypothetical protein